MSEAVAPLLETRSAAADAVAFIERQLPVSRLSKESYKERKANAGQTLTALGSYWKGRKPLILIRATILGLLLPATHDPERDRAIFLKLMLMDEAGLRKRKAKPIPATQAKQLLPAYLHDEAFDQATGGWLRRLPGERRAELELRAFEAMGLDEKLTYCLRPEELPDSALGDGWPEVNAHLGTDATSLPELVRQLGERRFGHRPRVGDPFCGGGSIPFEAARLGCDVYAADLNPIACLLTWGALNIVGGDDETRWRIAEAQQAIVTAVDRRIVELGFEHDAGPHDVKLPIDAPTRWPHGWRVGRSGEAVAPEATPYTVICPVTFWRVPMIETRRVHERSRTILDLVPDPARQRYDLVPRSDVSDEEWEEAARGTVIRDAGDFRLVHRPEEHAEPVRVRIANRAKAYLYCLETRCPRTSWMVPRRRAGSSAGTIARSPAWCRMPRRSGFASSSMPRQATRISRRRKTRARSRTVGCDTSLTGGNTRPCSARSAAMSS